MSAALSELDRRLANVLRLGTISELDEAGGLVRVQCGDITTDWLPWFTHRAGQDRTWHAPEVGEQVMVLSPSGEMAQGAVLPAIYQDSAGAPANLKTKSRTEYADGGFQEYDRAAHAFKLDVPAGGAITLHIGASTLVLSNSGATLTTPALLVDCPNSTFSGNVLIQGALTYQGGMSGSGGATAAAINGSVIVTGGDVKADGVGLKTHKHSGVQTGGGQTGTGSG